jgi:hypothetical protein
MKPNRFYSKKQENKVASAIGGKRQPNSGATMFKKGDVVADDILIECKTLTKKQLSHTIKKEWLEKNAEEAFAVGKDLSALAFDFGDGDNYYILSERDFKQLYEAWRRENEENSYPQKKQ